MTRLPELTTLSLSVEELSDSAHIGVVQLNRPRKLNALNATLIGELDQALDALQAPGLRALILTGAGDRAFAAGADIGEMADYRPIQALQMARRGQRVLDRLAAFPVPTIAAVNGFALGGGCELAMCCDFILASPTAVFGQPEVKIGVIPGFGGTQRLVRRVGSQRAMELMMTGRNVPADEAVALGLALDVHDDVMAAARELAGRISRAAPRATRRVKRAVLGADTLLAPGLATEAWLFAECFGDADQSEGMTAFLERRRPVYRDA